jgi:hypothetical protein
MGDPGDLLRVRLRKRKMLKLKAGRSIAKAYTVEEKERMLAEAKKARSPHIFPAIMRQSQSRDRFLPGMRRVIAQKWPQLRRVLRECPHKSPHNRSFLTLIGE